MHIILADVSRIGARMHRDAICAGIQTGTRGAHDIRFMTTARIAQNRNLVDVDAKAGAHVLRSPGMMTELGSSGTTNTARPVKGLSTAAGPGAMGI